ncbi:hypothetical protein SAMN05444156_2264 [Verrucomicrobium sp. GAS474]|uniref:hypothetical protein n=1 Tax=Verrucomicrobium sp. GAS474 TaxID=1882831 RepID=UPI00087D7F0E|nr:hypothetical protein [Verrucomicrobium sp. GAS474]SDU15093.1 hypothetical protein SAMN05444156_2264 [Verrucomicrobium sp. GAS474]
MIALPQRLPYVLWKGDRLLPLSEDWLAESLSSGSRAAGHDRWDLSAHIARAIVSYLEEEYCAATITPSQVNLMLAQSVEKVGFGDIAGKTALIAPRLAISLAEIADSAPYELLFYLRLREKLDDVVDMEVRGLICGDLRPCVKILDQAPRWRTTCDALSEQIVTYIRTYMTSDPRRSFDFAIV